MIIEKVDHDIWKIKADSNSYLITGDTPFVIDTGDRMHRDRMNHLTKILPAEKVKTVIFTHLHYDHIGNFDLFPNAKFFASANEIQDLKKNPSGTILNERMIELFNVKLETISDFDGWRIIPCPGHTRGSISIWHPERKILFSGDTLFKRGGIGRVDLPTSQPQHMDATLKRISGLDHKILCPGHEY